jgi:hypothetical protein
MDITWLVLHIGIRCVSEYIVIDFDAIADR